MSIVSIVVWTNRFIKNNNEKDDFHFLGIKIEESAQYLTALHCLFYRFNSGGLRYFPISRVENKEDRKKNRLPEKIR